MWTQGLARLGASLSRIVAAATVGATLVVFLPVPAFTHETWVLDQDNIPRVQRYVVDREQWASGSGVVVAPLVVLTARHVTNSLEDRVEVVFNGGVRVPARVWCLSTPSRDFSILSVAVPNPAHTDHILRMNPALPAIGSAVTIAGWPNGEWAVLPATVLYETENARIGGDGEDIVMANITWAGPTGGYAERRGFSGGPVFDAEGTLRGIICCVNLLNGFVGFVPIKYGLSECPLIPARR